MTRTLKFIVDGDKITQNPLCDFSGLFPGKNDNVIAKFEFSEDWKSATKVVAFTSIMGKEYPPQVVNDEDSCQIPIEALSRPSFRIQLFGKSRGKTLSTNHLTVYQRGGAV